MGQNPKEQPKSLLKKTSPDTHTPTATEKKSIRTYKRRPRKLTGRHDATRGSLRERTNRLRRRFRSLMLDSSAGGVGTPSQDLSSGPTWTQRQTGIYRCSMSEEASGILARVDRSTRSTNTRGPTNEPRRRQSDT